MIRRSQSRTTSMLARAVSLLVLLAASLVATTATTSATVGDGDASCACPLPGPYVAPAGVRSVFVGGDGASAPTSPRYRVSATGNLPAITLTIRRTSDNSLVDTIVTDLPSWGFSPDQDRFVVTGLRNGLHEVQVHDLTAADPSDVLVGVSTTEDSGRLGFSPHGEFFAYTGLVDGTNDTVHTQIWDARTGVRRLDTQYIFALGPSGAGTFGEAGFGFSPDDDEFFLAYRMDAQAVSWSLHDLDSGTLRTSGTMTGTGFWQFSPCGEMLAILSQNNQTTMDATLYATDDGTVAASASYPVGSIAFTRTATHHRAVVDGVGHDLVAVSPPVPDVCAPTWPGDAALEGEATAAGEVSLTWSPAVDDTEVTRYRVYRGTTLLTTTTGPTPRTFVVTGLTPSTSYTFRVEAGDAAGHWSDDGPTVQIGTLGGAPTWPPGAELTASAVTSTGLTLSWPAAVDDSAVAGYRIYRDGDLLAHRPASPRTYAVTGLAPGTSYAFTVQAVDGDGLESADGPSRTTATDAREPLDRNAITGRVFRDGNANGIVDGGDYGLPTPPSNDWTAMLFVFAYRIDSGGQVLESRSSDTAADGGYALEGLTPGTWLVGEANFDVLPSGMRLQTRPGDLQPYVVQVAAASGWAHVDFAMTDPTSITGQPVPDFPGGAGTITQTVYEDLDRDGVRDAGEPGVPGVPTLCYRVTTAGGGGCSETPELPGRGVTDASGVGVLDQLGSGVYEAFSPQKRGIYSTSPNKRYAVATGTGGTSAHPEFGVIVGRSSIVGEVFDDADGDGVREAGEALLHDDWPCAEGPLASQCGEAAGDGYRIPLLVDDTYQLHISVPDGTRVTTGGQQQVVIAANGASVEAAPIGLHDLRGTVRGAVFEDADGDGVRDAGEPGIPALAVCQRAPGDEGGHCVDTDADGVYVLEGVLPGAVEVTPQYSGPLAPTYDVKPGTSTTREVVLPEAGDLTVDLGFGTPPGEGNVPGVPRNVSAVPGPGSFTVTWEPPEDLGDDPDLTYRVRYALDVEGATWSESPSTRALSTTVTGLPGETALLVAVMASSSVGDGPASSPQRVVTGATTPVPPPPGPSSPPTTPPTVPPTSTPVPTAVAPSAPRDLKAVVRPTGIKVTWRAPASAGSSAVTRYAVEVATSRKGPWKVAGRPTTRSMLLTRLRRGTTYWIRVRATNAVGPGPWTARVKVRWR